MSRSRWPWAGGAAVGIKGHPPGVRGRRMAPGWSLRRGRRWMAFRWQRHVPRGSPGHASWGGPMREGRVLDWWRVAGEQLWQLAVDWGEAQWRWRPGRTNGRRESRSSALVALSRLDSGDSLSEDKEGLESRMRDRPSLLDTDLSPMGLLDREQQSARFDPDLGWAHGASRSLRGTQLPRLIGIHITQWNIGTWGDGRGRWCPSKVGKGLGKADDSVTRSEEGTAVAGCGRTWRRPAWHAQYDVRNPCKAPPEVGEQAELHPGLESLPGQVTEQ